MRKKALDMIKHRETMKAKGFDLLKVLQSEITHELTSPCFRNNPSGSPGDFTLEWDAPHSQDIVLRKKCDTTGEEVAVSAILGSDYVLEGTYPRCINMKVCIKKPGLSSLLQFNCKVFNENYDGPDFNICLARCLTTKSSSDRRYYTGPVFRDLDPNLQDAFKTYLEARGIGQSLMDFLIQHIHKKEEAQYVNWLQTLQKTVS